MHPFDLLTIPIITLLEDHNLIEVLSDAILIAINFQLDYELLPFKLHKQVVQVEAR